MLRVGGEDCHRRCGVVHEALPADSGVVDVLSHGGGSGGAGEVSVQEKFLLQAGLAVVRFGDEVGGAGCLGEVRNAAIVVDGGSRAEIGSDAFKRADRVEGGDAGAAATDGDAGVGV